MSRIIRVSVVDSAIEILRQSLAEGVWNGRLPGTRVLADHLGVSQPTISQAMKRLSEEGWLRHSGARKAYQVCAARIPAEGCMEKVRKPRQIVILTHAELYDIAESSRAIVYELQRTLSAEGWQVLFKIVNFLHAKTPHSSWDEVIGRDPDIPIIALFGRPCLAEWARKWNLRILFLGGVTDGHPITKIGVQSSDMALQAVEKLIQLGHQWIVLPLCSRPNSYNEQIKQSVRRAFAKAGHLFLPSYHCPERQYMEPDVIWRLMESSFQKRPPTAFVFLDFKELITGCCYLAHEGIRVPQDVSLVMLNNHTDARWLAMDVTRFSFPATRIVNAIVGWVRERDSPAKEIHFPTEFHPGKTIAPSP